MSLHEERARAKKVDAILALVPLHLARNGAQLRRMADRLLLFTPEERERWAKRAGIKPPSATTWAAAVEAILMRARNAEARP